MNRVGIVGSYSRVAAPSDLESDCSSLFDTSSISVSNGVDSFRASHHLT